MNEDQEQPDAELVRRAVAGSTPAFETLYERHAPGVARALASFAGPDRDLLDDLVQETFLRVVKRLDSYAPTHPFTHWLYTVALNVGRNHVRRTRKVTVVDDAILEDVAAPSTDPPAAPDLMAIVALLPGPMQEVVALRASAELTYIEIGELLGIPEGTARSRMHNAIRLLRAHLTEQNLRKCKSDG